MLGLFSLSGPGRVLVPVEAFGYVRPLYAHLLARQAKKGDERETSEFLMDSEV